MVLAPLVLNAVVWAALGQRRYFTKNMNWKCKPIRLRRVQGKEEKLTKNFYLDRRKESPRLWRASYCEMERKKLSCRLAENDLECLKIAVQISLRSWAGVCGRVARWFIIFKPEIPVWVNLGGP
jgi:hypothetical protein